MFIDPEATARLKAEWASEERPAAVSTQSRATGMNPFVFMILGSGTIYYVIAVILTGRFY
jgi:hypothetical protein